MRDKKLIVISIALIMSSVLCINVFGTYDDGSRYYNMDGKGFYHANNPETGITLVQSINPEFENSVMYVEIITSGDLYEKYSKYYDGDISLYDIHVKKDDKELSIIPGEDFIELIFPDEDFGSEKTADIYHINADGTITALPTWRDWLMDANATRITSFGLFIKTDAKIIDESNLFVPTPSPSPVPIPTKTPEPTFAYPSPGDVNIDFAVDAKDALVILKVAAKIETLSAYELSLADINADGKIDALDALMVLKIAAKIY